MLTYFKGMVIFVQIKITFGFEVLKLPFSYNRILQALVLKWINDKNYAGFIHEKGYSLQKRKYKLFTFSNLFGDFTIDYNKKVFKFLEKAYLLVSSHDDLFIEYVGNTLLKEKFFDIKSQKVEILNVELKKFPNVNKIRVITKSPITVYSTKIIDGKKWVNYYTPYDQEFYDLIVDNLIRKFKAYYGQYPNEKLEIKHIGKKAKERIIIYKNTVIKGWLSLFELEGDRKLLELAFDSGLGSKNSIGFGCIDIL